MSRLLVAFFILWVPFTLMAAAAALLSLWALLTDRWDYAKSVLAAMDRLGAAVIGWTGKNTVSAELGRSRPGCLLCKFLSVFEADHCVKAARAEGLISS